MVTRHAIGVLILLTLLALAGCGAANEAADEGANAVQSGMKTADKAEDYGAQKEDYDKQGDDLTNGS